MGTPPQDHDMEVVVMGPPGSGIVEALADILNEGTSPLQYLEFAGDEDYETVVEAHVDPLDPLTVALHIRGRRFALTLKEMM